MAYTVAANTVCSIRVVCSANNGAIKWANTHEYVALTDISYSMQLDAANTIANAYSSIMLPPYRVDRVVISSWVPDGRPYNPDTFNVFAYAVPGDRTRSSSEPVDLTICMSYVRAPTGGRTGRMLLRGVLTEEMLSWSAGRYNFAFPSGLDGVDYTQGENAMIGLRTLLSGNLIMVMASSAGYREVIAIRRGPIVFKKLNNKYFNRLQARPTP